MEGRYGPGCANERDLFHGASADAVDYICKTNVDFQRGKNDTPYGKGAYFYLSSKNADMISTPDDRGHKFIFMAKVLVGKVCVGKSAFEQPPPITPGDPRSPRYDTCVEDCSNPATFVVFDKSQFYPEYIIEFQ
jgi:hypothetical protein